MKLLEENIGSELFEISLSNILLGYVSSGKDNENKNEQMALHQSERETHQQNEKTTDW